MDYDFTTILDRSACGSSKWNEMYTLDPQVDPDVIPMSKADMEFLTAPEIREGLKDYIDKTALGYTKPTPAYYEAVVRWQRERHGFDAKAEWIVTTPGVLRGIQMLVELLSSPGDGVIIQPPVYYPFPAIVRMTGRKLVQNPLIERDGVYEIDFADLEEKAKDPHNKLLIFCSPHNPVGRVWRREELERLMKICIANDVFVIDDEIHNDLIMPGVHHTVLPSLSQEAAEHCAYCTASSKTFNLAGMQQSNLFLADPKIRGRLTMAKMLAMDTAQTALGYESCRLAYEKGGPWLDALLPVIQGNADYVRGFLAEHFPAVRCCPLEGTYLLWVDFRGLGLTHKELNRLMLDAKLFLDEGPMFGKEGRGFERFNLALPRSAVVAAMERLLTAWQNLHKAWEANGRPEHITLELGMAMPDFSYDTPFKAGLRFSDAAKGKKTILLFHRYYTCPLCHGALEQLATDYDMISGKGSQLLVVLESGAETVRPGSENLPFPIICDPERRLYDRFNIFTADSQIDLLGDGVQADLSTLLAAFQNNTGAPPEGSSDQMPAWCIVDEAGIITHIHYGESVFDTPTAKELANYL